MTKLVGFIGGPCTGKTTLAQTVLSDLTAQQYRASWSREIASDDIPVNGIPDLDYIIYEQFRFCLHQYRIEEEAKKKADIVITDGPLLIGYIYALQQADTLYKGRQNKIVKDFEKFIEQDKYRYQHLYLLKREGEYEDNSIRFHTLEESLEVDEFIKVTLDKYNIPYTLLSGNVEQRTNQVINDITPHDVQKCVAR